MQHAIETPSIFAPVSTPAFAIRNLSFFVLAMLLVVVVHPEEEFRAWVASQQATPLEQETTRPGRELFSSLAWLSSGRAAIEGHHA